VSFHHTLRQASATLRQSPTWTALARIQRLLDEGRYTAALCQAEESFAAGDITALQLRVVEYQCEGRVV
jgi:hypothetical protein